MRLFWLGMHKILVKTELPRLRELGYEVFNPPYLSPIVDQSAELNWDRSQKSTLPAHVFRKLSEYNFFYNPISQEIAQILREYFDAIVVTIHPGWLLEILKVYPGKVIYRTYGQVHQQSELLMKNGAYKYICENPLFYFSPHAEEAIATEDVWLKERAHVIPYCLTGDIFDHAGKYNPDLPKSGEVILTCPNIDNEYYYQHYKFIKKSFPQNYRMYGVQLRKVNDAQVMGVIPRVQFIENFLNASAYLYTYDDSRVCYLPPIEMMILGGPVIFLKGSLLDRYYGKGAAPGRANSVKHAIELCERLRHGDVNFAKEIIQSQKNIPQIYYPEHVWPIFDEKMREMLSNKPQTVFSPFLLPQKGSQTQDCHGKTHVILFHHFPGECINAHEGTYAAKDGIPRVMRWLVKALLESGKFKVTITTHRRELSNFYGFFRVEGSSDLQILSLDDVVDLEMPLFVRLFDFVQFLKRFPWRKRKLDNGLRKNLPPARDQVLVPHFSRIERFLMKNVESEQYRFLQFGIFGAVVVGPFLYFGRHFRDVARKKIKKTIKRMFKKYLGYLESIYDRFYVKTAPYLLVQYIHRNFSDAICLIPHYHHFPECLALKNKTIMYIPDFTPHFFEESGEFGLHVNESAIGQQLVKKTDKVFTNSVFSKGYLPASRLQVDSKKIIAFPLPNLNSEKGSEVEDFSEIEQIRESLGKQPFIFYPTQPRKNKNLGMLFRVFRGLLKDHPELRLVLTCNIEYLKLIYKEFKELEFRDRIFFFNDISDHSLSWLYQKSSALVFTSLMEGNFPPQIFEALYHRVPIVATRLPLITERLGDLSENLLLCDPVSLPEFLVGVQVCLGQREQVLQKQESVRDLVLREGSWEEFRENALGLFGEKTELPKIGISGSHLRDEAKGISIGN